MKKDINIRFDSRKTTGFGTVLTWIVAVVAGFLMAIGIVFMLCVTAVLILMVTPIALTYRLIYGVWPEWLVIESKSDSE
jgi:hypothetical protein